MPTEIAKKTILSLRFREYVPQIDVVFPIPMPRDAEAGWGEAAEVRV